MIQTTTEPILWDVPDATYYSDYSAVSWSMSEQFRASPARYRGLYITRDIPPDEPTPEMLLGSVVHTCVLERAKLLEHWLPVDCKIRNGKAWDAGCMAALASGKTAVPAGWVDTAEKIAKAVMAHPVAAWLLSAKGLVERPLRWTDPATGLVLKSKLDRLVMPESCPVVVDLKTCPDPSPEAFAKKVDEFGYHRQAVWYLAAAYRFTGRAGMSALIAAGKEPPYDVWVHRLPADWLAMGARENRELLNRLKLAYDTGDWFAMGQLQMNDLPPPRWVQREIDNPKGEMTR